MNKKKLLAKILQGTKNVKFKELETLIKAFGFELARINGSHHIYNRNDIPEIINIQNRQGQASPYQVKQFLAIIEKYQLSLEDEE
jgi:predicted RNA binding protein YcfA (HicA-like mRNA interferase family)